MKKDILCELSSLHEELGITEEWLHTIWNEWCVMNWKVTRMLKDPINFATMTDKELTDEYKTYAINSNNTDFGEKERLYRLFITYVRMINKEAKNERRKF